VTKPGQDDSAAAVEPGQHHGHFPASWENEPVGGQAQEADVPAAARTYHPTKARTARLRVDVGTVNKWRQRYAEEGWPTPKRPGRPPEFPAPGGTLDGIRPLSAAD